MDSSMTCLITSILMRNGLHDKSEEDLLFGSRWRTTRESSKKLKNFIQKVMFITAVARPCWDHISKKMFDGKIGMWPFVTYKSVKYNCKNKFKGTIVTNPIASVNRDSVREMVIRNLIPAIKRKIPLIRKK